MLKLYRFIEIFVDVVFVSLSKAGLPTIKASVPTTKASLPIT